MEDNNKSNNLIERLIKYLIKNKYWILLLGFLCAILLGSYAYLSPIKYEAKITFDLNKEDETGGIKLPGALASLGVNTSTQGFNMFKVISLTNTDKILFNVLLDSIGDHRVIELLLDKYPLKSSKFNSISENEFSELSIDEKVLLKNSKAALLEERLFQINYDKKSEIFNITSVTKDEDLSFILVNKLYNALGEFYDSQNRKSARINFERLQTRLDSTQDILKKEELKYARLKDKNTDIIFGKDQLQELRAFQTVQINTELYIEILKNYELAKYKMESITPTFSIVDIPFKPLRRYKKSIVKYGFLGFIVGLIVGSGILSLNFLISFYKK